MFALSQIEHDLPMPPHLLSRPLPDAIKAELERLFLDKVTRMLVPFSCGISIAGKILLGSASNTRTKPLSLTALVGS
jgi:DNA-directed RNA polymerase subunit E'/Rpb7